MRAAQNLVDHGFYVTSGASSAIVDLITQLPASLRAAVVVLLVLLIVARACVPALFRALDDHLLIRRARDKIESAEDWVEVLRIRNEPRRMVGRRSAPGQRPAISAAPGPPGVRPTAGDDPSGDAEDDPP
jgi:hypothetical protein